MNVRKAIQSIFYTQKPQCLRLCGSGPRSFHGYSVETWQDDSIWDISFDIILSSYRQQPKVDRTVVMSEPFIYT
jgi:hypothetical protein